LDVSWGFLFPPLSPASTEFIGFFIAPKDAGWVGISLGGGMVNNLLVVGWVNGNQPVASVRRAKYVPVLSHIINVTYPSLAIINSRIHGKGQPSPFSVLLVSMQPTSVSFTDAKNAHRGSVVQAGLT